MKKSTQLLFLSAFCLFGFTSDKPAYKVFTGKGKETDYKTLLKEAEKSDVIFFGEFHDNPICHWLQAELMRDLYKSKGDLLLMGAEMFEADNQMALNEYLKGLISEKTLKDESKIWPNYKTDYKPLLDFAREKKLPFIATNVPRRYANLVYSKGTGILDSLESGSKAFLPPLPFPYDPELKCYKDIFASAGGHGGENLPKSQALKDATMAHFIALNFTKGKTFLHFNGTYHSNFNEGIVWYLKKYRPELKIMVISSSLQKELATLDKESIGSGDFIICTPESITRTH
jgi:uncharacterized iron-regulated protein